MPPLHIKLGLMKQLMKGLYQSAAFRYLNQKIPQVSEAKIKEGIFVGPQFRELLNDRHFEAIFRQCPSLNWLVGKRFEQFALSS